MKHTDSDIEMINMIANNANCTLDLEEKERQGWDGTDGMNIFHNAATKPR